MKPNLEISNIEKILLENPHVIEIHHSDPFVRLKINKSLYRSDKRAPDMYNIWQYLENPCIRYDFTSHSTRRLWKWTLNQKLYNYVEKDTFRTTNNVIPNVIFSMFNEYYIGPNKDQLETKIEIAKEVYEEVKLTVRDPATEKSILAIEKHKSAVYDVLKFLSEQKPIKIL
ncbi:MAG: hypothetical protein PHF86_11565 [Candidatus Nanoarchaeia archaeon]|nr:hypothetical protein [Candidatus Nanoarchaeia archaeon]